MPGSVSLTGKDSIIIGKRVINDLADGDCVQLAPQNDIMNVKVSKNGNTIYALNNSGLVMHVTLRLLVGSSDDKFLNSLQLGMIADPSAFTLLTAQFTKRVGDGAGVISSVAYQCNGGVFKKLQESKQNSDGDTNQSVVVYELIFGNAPRSIQ